MRTMPSPKQHAHNQLAQIEEAEQTERKLKSRKSPALDAMMRIQVGARTWIYIAKSTSAKKIEEIKEKWRLRLDYISKLKEADDDSLTHITELE